MRARARSPGSGPSHRAVRPRPLPAARPPPRPPRPYRAAPRRASCPLPTSITRPVALRLLRPLRLGRVEGAARRRVGERQRRLRRLRAGPQPPPAQGPASRYPVPCYHSAGAHPACPLRPAPDRRRGDHGRHLRHDPGIHLAAERPARGAARRMPRGAAHAAPLGAHVGSRAAGWLPKASQGFSTPRDRSDGEERPPPPDGLAAASLARSATAAPESSALPPTPSVAGGR